MRRRNIIALALGAAVLAAIFFARPSLQRWAQTVAILRSEAPSGQSIDELLESSPDPTALMRRLWSTGRIPHRTYVLNHLRRREPGNTPWSSDLRKLVLEATGYGDVDVQQAALTVLDKHADPEVERVALGLLQDVDPELRGIVVRYLDGRDDSRLIPAFMALLDDPDRVVRTFAIGALRNLTDQDFGWQFTGDEASNRSAISKWERWWTENEHRYALAPVPEPMTWQPTSAPIAVDFTLTDLGGKSVRLSELRGKVVLLNFWATWCPPCIAEVPTLIELTRRHPDDLILLAISVDAVPHGHAHSPDDGHDHDDPEKLAATAEELVRRFVAKHSINYPVLVDHSGFVTAAYDGSGVPVSVLIDTQGRLRRRFVGERSVDVLEKMIAEASLALK